MTAKRYRLCACVGLLTLPMAGDVRGQTRPSALDPDKFITTPKGAQEVSASAGAELRQSAESGDAVSQNNLAYLYTFGGPYGAGLWLVLLGFVVMMVGTFLN